MRPTCLSFRSPQERTAEYRNLKITSTGQAIDMKHRITNSTGTNLPKDVRFKPMPLYCKGSGANCFLGPGSYNYMDSFKALNRTICPTKITKIGFINEKEVGKGCYVMQG